MSLLWYFKVSSDTTKLPDPRGPVCRNRREFSLTKKGHCEKFYPELRFQIGKHAAESGVAAMMHFYAIKKFLLKESSVRMLKLCMR